MSATQYHVSVNIEGLLRNYKNRKMNGLLVDESGKSLSDYEAREFLQQCIDEGMKLIPNHNCKGFDPMGNGCPGHKIE